MFFLRWKVTWLVLTLRSCKREKYALNQSVTHLDKRTAYLDVHLVTTKNNGNVLAHPLVITVPVGDILVGNAGGNIEHDDTALALNVVTIAETTELLLTGGIPDVELDLAEVLREGVVGSASGSSSERACKHTFVVIEGH